MRWLSMATQAMLPFRQSFYVPPTDCMDQSAGVFFSKFVISGYSSPNQIADFQHQQQGV